MSRGLSFLFRKFGEHDNDRRYSSVMGHIIMSVHWNLYLEVDTVDERKIGATYPTTLQSSNQH